MQLKKITGIGLFCLLVSGSLWGQQQVSLSFPAAAQQTINLYYFSGARADTLTATLDVVGKAIFTLPLKDYRGIIVLGNKESGSVELVLAESQLEVVCRASKLNIETVEWINSAENDYLKWIFSTQSQRIRLLGWLEQGEMFHADLDLSLVTGLKEATKQTNQTFEQTQSENGRSPLFAARYYEAVSFMNRLYEAEQYPYPQSFQAMKAEMETAAVIPTMYRSGNMWMQMHNMYISLFNRMESMPNQRLRYVESIINTLHHLQQPYYEGFLTGSIMEMERFGWLSARDTLLAHVIKENPHFNPNIPALKLSISAFLMRSNKIAPEIVGLSTPRGNEKMVVVFHDSDCNTCVNEMNTLARRYSVLKKNNIRVVSIAADKNATHFETESRNFPWQDKLCDFQGFEGVNFTTFGVMATPTFFVISQDGMIESEFNNINELMEKLFPE